MYNPPKNGQHILAREIASKRKEWSQNEKSKIQKRFTGQGLRRSSCFKHRRGGSFNLRRI